MIVYHWLDSPCNVEPATITCSIGVHAMNKTRDAYAEIGQLLTAGPVYQSSIIWNYMEGGYPCEYFGNLA